jgi:D-alanine-D-alanine ligase
MAAPQKGGTKGGKVSGFADKKIPAEVSDETKEKIQELAKEVFKVLGCSGVCRIDFLIDKEKDIIYVNEINTIPGALSYYLWEASGKTFTEELDQVIDIALKKRREKEKLTFSNEINILAMQGSGVKGQKGIKGTKGKM